MGWFGRGKSSDEDGRAVDEAVRTRTLFSRNMALRVAAPVGDGWQIMEAGSGAGGLLAAIRCLHGEPPEAMALNAYAYAVTDGDPHTVEQLSRQDWRRRWQGSTFEVIEGLDVEVVERPGTDRACQICVEGIGRHGRGPLRVVEQHVPAGSRRLVVSAAGSPSRHAALAAVVRQWLVHASLGA